MKICCSFLRLNTALGFSFWLLSGCALHQPKPIPISANWPQHQTQVQAFSNWQATGKLAVKVPNDGGSMGLHWQQHDNLFQIDFSAPFGQQLLSLEGDATGVTLTEPNQAPLRAKTAEDLIRAHTGWSIPVTQLAFWVRGLPDPQTKIVHFATNDQGFMGELEQLGWKITYGEYLNVASSTGTVPMPGRIIAEFKDVRLTLVIRAWQLDPAL
jgi:outer membrane lipoprotein LolB